VSDASRLFYSQTYIAAPSGKGITQRDEIIAKRSIVALFETIIALGWTRIPIIGGQHNFILHA